MRTIEHWIGGASTPGVAEAEAEAEDLAFARAVAMGARETA